MEAGLRLLPWTATLFFTAPIAGLLVNRLGERRLVVTGLTLNAIGLAWLGLTASVGLSLAGMAPALVVMGVGVSMAMPSLQSGIMRTVQPTDIGKASGAFSMSQFIGGAFGVAITASVFSAFGSYQGPEAFTAGFKAVIYCTALFAVIGALAATALPGKVRQSAGLVTETA